MAVAIRGATASTLGKQGVESESRVQAGPILFASSVAMNQ